MPDPPVGVCSYPCFQNPYSMDLHESPVTFCTYLADCPTDLIPAFYSVGSKANKRGGFSEKVRSYFAVCVLHVQVWYIST